MNDEYVCIHMYISIIFIFCILMLFWWFACVVYVHNGIIWDLVESFYNGLFSYRNNVFCFIISSVTFRSTSLILLPSGERVLVFVDVVCVRVCVCVRRVRTICFFACPTCSCSNHVVLLRRWKSGRIYLFIYFIRNQMTRYTICMFLLFLCYDFHLDFHDKLCCFVVAERRFFSSCVHVLSVKNTQQTIVACLLLAF
jgi:hypothetical protein